MLRIVTNSRRLGVVSSMPNAVIFRPLFQILYVILDGKNGREKEIQAMFFLSLILYFFSAKPDAREQNTGGHQREAE
jgi:hypothetical protein